MKKPNYFVFLMATIALMLLSGIAFADDPPPPPPPGGGHGATGNQGPMGAPLGGGLVVFLAFAGSAAGYELLKKWKKSGTTEHEA